MTAADERKMASILRTFVSHGKKGPGSIPNTGALSACIKHGWLCTVQKKRDMRARASSCRPAECVCERKCGECV
ncbi:unnamed protein product [Lampetra fluviatilis]